MKELEAKLKEQVANRGKDVAATLAKNKAAGGIEIEIGNDGTYLITQWEDPNQNYDLDGMIFEVFKNDGGQF